MLYIGIDWSQEKHDVCICNEQGAAVSRLTIAHSLDGFRHLRHEISKLEIAPEECIVAIETAYNLLVDYLADHNYAIHIIAPQSTKSYRNRIHSSGAHDDQSDAALLAWIVRVDREHHRRWRPNNTLTQRIMGQVRLIEQLRRSSQRLQSQLQAALLRTFPTALDAFALDSQIALRFLSAFPTDEEARKLSWDDFSAFCQQNGYRRKALVIKRYQQLHRIESQASRAAVEAHRNQVCVLARVLLVQVQERNKALAELSKLFEQHPDHDIFSSLPGTGQLLAPSLLAKFGDDRQRFPHAGSVQALAGTCPVTLCSGKKKRVCYRTSCDREFRRIAQQFSYCSLRQCGWAQAYWREIRPRCSSDSHATRIVANRWLAIIWKLWQTHQTYDDAYHLRQRVARRLPVA